MNSETEDTLSCPTFSSYLSNQLVEIATKVSNECKNEEQNDDDSFQFASSINDLDSSMVPKSIFPVFNVNKLDETDRNIEKNRKSNVTVPLRNLFLEERENPSSTSSSESEESESEQPGSNCVWRRKTVGSSPTSCKKSKSTGSILFKRFKICDFLRRSNSDGKDSYLFTTKTEKNDGRKSPRHSVEISRKVVTGKVTSPASSAHELFYMKNRLIKEGDKRKSYLPYRKDLIGFFSVLGRASRT